MTANPIDDRTCYVLGWNNEAKIAALAKQERDLATRIHAHAQQILSRSSAKPRSGTDCTVCGSSLELFRHMNLQLLIVTPLQKIHVIEPYVAGLGFVHSEKGRLSMLRYLSIEEFRTERETHAG